MPLISDQVHNSHKSSRSKHYRPWCCPPHRCSYERHLSETEMPATVPSSAALSHQVRSMRLSAGQGPPHMQTHMRGQVPQHLATFDIYTLGDIERNTCHSISASVDNQTFTNTTDTNHPCSICFWLSTKSAPSRPRPCNCSH